MDRPVIQTDGLTKRCGIIAAVDWLSTEVRRGRAYGLLGPNGSSKIATVWTRFAREAGGGQPRTVQLCGPDTAALCGAAFRQFEHRDIGGAKGG